MWEVFSRYGTQKYGGTDGRQHIYLHNKNQPYALSFLIYFNNYPLHVSNRLTIHHQEAANMIVLAASQCGCMIYTIDCIYSKLPPDDE